MSYNNLINLDYNTSEAGTYRLFLKYKCPSCSVYSTSGIFLENLIPFLSRPSISCSNLSSVRAYSHRSSNNVLSRSILGLSISVLLGCSGSSGRSLIYIGASSIGSISNSDVAPCYP